MRTTLRLSDDVYHAVRALAEADRKSIGETASELIRRGLKHTSGIVRKGHFPMFEVSEDAPPITLEAVKCALDDEA